MAKGQVQAMSPSRAVAQQVLVARQDRLWRQSDLVDRLEELGFTGWRQSKIAKIERGEVMRLSLDDTVALATALGVQLPHLLATDAEVQLAPKLKRTPLEFKQWLRGYLPLRPEDERFYYSGKLVPDDEFGVLLANVQAAAADPAMLANLAERPASLKRARASTKKGG